MKPLDTGLLKKFLKRAGDRLQGEWLLVGGVLLPAVGIQVRSTVDIDLIGLGQAERNQSLKLMELAESLGLSVETINQAAAFFLDKTKYAKSDLFVLHQGKSATIYRPSAELYWHLKLNRQTEADIEDCKHYFKFCQARKDKMNTAKMKGLLKNTMSKATGMEKQTLLTSLLAILNSNP